MIGSRTPQSNDPLHHCTVAHCCATPLYCGTLLHYTIVLCKTAALRHCTVAHCCTTPLYYGTLLHYTTVLCQTAALRHCTVQTAALHHCTVAHCCTTPLYYGTLLCCVVPQQWHFAQATRHNYLHHTACMVHYCYYTTPMHGALLLLLHHTTCMVHYYCNYIDPP